MSLKTIVLHKNLINYTVIRALSGAVKGPSSAKPSAAAEKSIPTDVPGLSGKCVRSTTEPVGPGAKSDGDYKVPEYFCFNKLSYYEAEIEMSKYRCPQPDARH